ncbi:MAG: tetratricopeptide repeat protein [Candidatus Thiodiazotropha sp. (ex. Lucinisca nassula)]|nr:tetratricopeptide repeat protein [Candidatus Thiodiazotropha sp. (ex. Lucinisca nassula)]MBW9276114.1 tetratricopeptide repeat protein [Candidatus Thiodiazotropha sp. (ex. Lucinisca nassula)]
MKARYLILTIALFIGACANPINERTAINYYQAGEEAMINGQLLHAKEMFSRALINARLGHMGDEAEGQVLKKLGQVHGNLCEYSKAEQSFLEAVSKYEIVYGKGSPLTFPVRAELAQFCFDTGQYPKAIKYYERALKVGESKLKEVDPKTYSLIMYDYSVALEQSGNLNKSKQVLAVANEYSTKAVAASVAGSEEYVPYPKSCAK